MRFVLFALVCCRCFGAVAGSRGGTATRSATEQLHFEPLAEYRQCPCGFQEPRPPDLQRRPGQGHRKTNDGRLCAATFEHDQKVYAVMLVSHHCLRRRVLRSVLRNRTAHQQLILKALLAVSGASELSKSWLCLPICPFARWPPSLSNCFRLYIFWASCGGRGSKRVAVQVSRCRCYLEAPRRNRMGMRPRTRAFQFGLGARICVRSKLPVAVRRIGRDIAVTKFAARVYSVRRGQHLADSGPHLARQG